MITFCLGLPEYFSQTVRQLGKHFRKFDAKVLPIHHQKSLQTHCHHRSDILLEVLWSVSICPRLLLACLPLLPSEEVPSITKYVFPTTHFLVMSCVKYNLLDVICNIGS